MTVTRFSNSRVVVRDLQTPETFVAIVVVGLAPHASLPIFYHVLGLQKDATAGTVASLSRVWSLLQLRINPCRVMDQRTATKATAATPAVNRMSISEDIGMWWNCVSTEPDIQV